MLVKKLQHYNVRTTKFQESVAFYREVLELKKGVQPDVPEDTLAWLYDESGEAIVHLMAIDPSDPEGDYARQASFRGGSDQEHPPAFSGSGSIDHVALSCEGREEMLARLKRLDIPFRENYIAQLDFWQIFIFDPNGVTLELNFLKN